MRKYGFWSLIALLTALTVHDVYVLVDEYMENPRQVDMMVIFNETITFPNITFCADMRQFSAFFAINASMQKTWDEDLEKALKKFKNKKQFLEKDWEYHMTAEAMSVAMSLTSIELETDTNVVPMNLHQLPRNPRLHGKNQMINDWMKRLKDLDVSYAEFYQKTGLEILTKGLHRMRRMSQSDDEVFSISHKIMWISQRNFCFQPTFVKDEPITSQGQFLLFQAKIDLEKLAGHDIDCMKADFHGRPSDIVRYMDGPSSARDGVADNLCFGQYIEVRAEVKNTFDMLPNDSPGRECDELKSEGKNDYDCKLYCRIEFVRNLCACTPISLEYLVEDKLELAKYPICNYTTCQIDPKSIDLKTEPLCKKECKRDCNQIRYIITKSNAKKTLALTNKHKSIISRDLITVSFNWGSFEYIGLEQAWKYSPVAFASALGGAIGVYLGLSVLTLVVGLIYGADMSYKYLNNYYTQRRQASQRKRAEAEIPSNTNGTTTTE